MVKQVCSIKEQASNVAIQVCSMTQQACSASTQLVATGDLAAKSTDAELTPCVKLSLSGPVPGCFLKASSWSGKGRFNRATFPRHTPFLVVRLTNNVRKLNAKICLVIGGKER